MKMIGICCSILIPFATASGRAEPERFEALQRNVLAILETLEVAKNPISASTREEVRTAIDRRDADALDRALVDSVLLRVVVNPEGRVRVGVGSVVPDLSKGKSVLTLIRIENQSGGSQQLTPSSRYTGGANPFRLEFVDAKGHGTELKGSEVEYRLLKVVCAEVGKRELTISFDAGQGTQDLGFRGEVPILFEVTDRK